MTTYFLSSFYTLALDVYDVGQNPSKTAVQLAFSILNQTRCINAMSSCRPFMKQYHNNVIYTEKMPQKSLNKPCYVCISAVFLSDGIAFTYRRLSYIT
jgi:hypothetical protein